MKNMTQSVRLSVVLLGGFSLAACAPLFADGKRWGPGIGPRAVQTDLGSAIGYYDMAVTSINARHYALALEYLQAARAQRPDDVRVLTAFGVVYDKLGRFDLSARYYTQAAAVDPLSKIVAADVDYSRRLQGLAVAGSGSAVVSATADSPQASPPVIVAEGTLMQPAAPVPRYKISVPDVPYSSISAPSDLSQVPRPVIVPEGPLTQAAAQAPQYKIAAPDLNYSATLQGLTAAGSAPVMVLAASDEGPRRPTLAEQRSSIPLENLPAVPPISASANLLPLEIANRAEAKVLFKLGAEAPPQAKTVFLTGHPLKIFDASGRSDAGKTVRSYLTGLGWVLTKGQDAKVPAQAQTAIVYRQAFARVAKALARTLSLPARLTINPDAEGLRLVLGGDISRAKLPLRAMQPSRRQLALAGKTGKPE
jgi:tetratricopeptide (TPR) repeat protein